MDTRIPSDYASELGNAIDVRNDFAHSHEKRADTIPNLLRYTLILYVISCVMIDLYNQQISKNTQ